MKDSNYTTGIPGWKVVCIVLFVLMTGSVQAQQNKKSGVHVGLVYPVSSHGSNAGEFTNRFSFHLLGGLSKNETGFSFSGLSTLVLGDAGGAQFAGFSNHIRGKSSGAQFAGFMNLIDQAGGLQMAGFLNGSKNATGTQLAGFSNLSAQNGGKMQMAGFLNMSKDVTTQVAGFMNMGRNVNTQVSGFLNIAENVKGVQIGVINSAQSSKNPIGLVNIVKNGEMAIRVTGDELGTITAGFRSGGKNLYGVLGMGYNGKSKNNMYALEGAIGANLVMAEYFRIFLEGSIVTLDDFKKGEFMKTSLRLLPAVRIGNNLEIFAGPSLNYAYFDIASGKGQDLVNHFFWSEKAGSEHFQGMFLGATGGIQYKFRN